MIAKNTEYRKVYLYYLCILYTKYEERLKQLDMKRRCLWWNTRSLEICMCDPDPLSRLQCPDADRSAGAVCDRGI